MDTDTLKRSVTAGDYATGPRNGVIHFMMPTFGPQQPELPAYWSRRRDIVLRASIRREAMWSATIHIALTKIVSWSWEVSGDVGTRVRRAQRLLIEAEGGKGWVNFLMKTGRDFFTTDNGTFIERVHATGAPGSRLLGLFHLDSCRCTRTGDVEFPVIYQDKRGREHVLRSHQVMAFSDMPEPGDMLNGVGFCAASRAWTSIITTAAIEEYLYDKVTGRRPTNIYITDAITDSQLETALAAAQAQASARGARRYMGAVVIARLGDVGQRNLLTIPLAEVPDAFDPEKQRRHNQLVYAAAMGMDPQEVNPDLLASRSLGSGAQAQVIDDKTTSKGLSGFKQEIMFQLNNNVMDDRTTFYIVESDYREIGLRAQVSKARTEVTNSLIASDTISRQEARQILVDQKELPKEFVPNDTTPTVTLNNIEKEKGKSHIVRWDPSLTNPQGQVVERVA